MVCDPLADRESWRMDGRAACGYRCAPMPHISLFDISNRPRGNYPPRARLLRYEVRRADPHWWVLTVTIPVTYRFAADQRTWPEPGRVLFKREFEAFASETWSRRHIVFSDQFANPIRTEVHVRVVEDATAAAPYLWHVWALPWAIPDAPTCVSYDFDGAFPIGRRDDGTVEYGERVQDIALAQISVDDIDCSTAHLGGSGVPRMYLQRGTDHEVGHMLGLQHPRCNGNQRICYGSGPGERRSVMGHGSEVRPEDYIWAQRIMESYTDHRRPWRIAAERWYAPRGAPIDRSGPICR